jgi:hypothetical protein
MSARDSRHDASSTDGRAHFQIAFEQTAAERAALATGDLRPLNLEIRSAVAVVLGAAPQLAKMKADIRELPRIDAARIERLPLYAEALFFANVEYLATSSAGDDLPGLARRAAALRATLASDARTLVKRGLIEPSALDAVKLANGYLALATELGVLTKVVRERWSTLASRTAIRAEDLEAAEDFSERVARAHGARKQPPEALTKAADDRARAFTLMVATYDDARRAVSFFRWREADVDALVPSLWQGRGGRRRASRGSDAGEQSRHDSPTVPTPSTPPRADAVEHHAVEHPDVGDHKVDHHDVEDEN